MGMFDYLCAYTAALVTPPPGYGRRRLPTWMLAAALLAGLPVHAAPPPEAVEFLAPRDGSRVGGGRVLVAVRLPKSNTPASLFLDGRRIEGQARDGRGLSALLAPTPGRHLVEVRDGRTMGRLSFSFGPAAGGSPVWVPHVPVAKGECRACHAGQGRRKGRTEAETCRGCHRVADALAFLHGPVGAGQCLFCHDPHGSIQPALGRHDAREGCRLCHDHPSSREHVNHKANGECGSCHDPHGGKNQFFLKKD